MMRIDMLNIICESNEPIGLRFRKNLDKWRRKHSDESEMTYYHLDEKAKQLFDTESASLDSDSIPSNELINIMHQLEIPVPSARSGSVETKRDPKFNDRFSESIKKIDGRESPHRGAIPNYRGINHDKVRQTLKSMGSSRGNIAMRSELLKLGTIDAVSEHMYYHGSANYIDVLRAGVSLPKNVNRGGGFGAMQHSISLTKSKRMASRFSGDSRFVSIYAVLLKKDARVIDVEGKVSDATELDEYIPELWDAKIDAVWIGGGESELVVLNPRCIIKGKSDSYPVHGMKSSDISNNDTRQFIESYGLSIDESGNITKPAESSPTLTESNETGRRINYMYISPEDGLDGDIESAVHDLLTQTGLHMLSRDEVRCVATDSDTGMIVGVLWVGDYGDSTTWSICVAEKYRNSGIARELYFEVIPSIESEKIDYGEQHEMIAELIAPYTLEKFVITNGYKLKDTVSGYRIYHKIINQAEIDIDRDDSLNEGVDTHIDKTIFDELKSMYSEHLIGGIGDGRDPDEFDQEQLYMGVLVEIEHTDDPMVAMELAIDHLSEMPEYYIHLQEMEDVFGDTSFTESVDDDYRGAHSAPTQNDSPLYDVTLNGGYPEDIYEPMGYHYYGEGDVAMDKESIAIMHYCHHKPNAMIPVYRAVPVDKKLKSRIRELKALIAYYINFGFFPINDKTVAPYKEKYWNPDVGYGKDYETNIRDDIRADIEKLEAQDAKIIINSGDWVTINKRYAKEHGEHALNGNYKILMKRVPAKCLFTDANSLHEFGYWAI